MPASRAAWLFTEFRVFLRFMFAVALAIGVMFGLPWLATWLLFNGYAPLGWLCIAGIAFLLFLAARRL